VLFRSKNYKLDCQKMKKSFQIITLFAVVAAAMAFAPNSVPKVVSTAKTVAPAAFNLKKAAAAAIPVATIAAPAFALDSIVEMLPTNTVALEVQFGAYLAVLLGTLLPVLFLINLFIQTESRKAGKQGGIDSD